MPGVPGRQGGTYEDGKNPSGQIDGSNRRRSCHSLGGVPDISLTPSKGGTADITLSPSESGTAAETLARPARLTATAAE